MRTSPFYTIVGMSLLLMPFSLHAQSYGPIGVSLDKNENIVLQGNGERLSGIQFSSKSGSLIPGQNNDPFQFALNKSPLQVTFGSLAENIVAIDGQVTLTTRWNPLSPADIQYSYGIFQDQIYGKRQPLELFRETPAPLDVMRVSLNRDNKWVLHGTGEKLEQFDLYSDRGGLVPAETPAPFYGVTLNDENSIRFVDLVSSVTVDGELTLDAGWDRNLGIRNVKYWFREVGEDLNEGPYVVPESVYPARPPISRVSVTIDDNDRKFVLKGAGHELRTFQLDSESGSLVPPQYAEPFQSMTENTKHRVAYAHEDAVILDGTLKLDAGYDIDVSGEDVSYRYQQLGHAKLRGPFNIASGEFPADPKKSPLRVSVNNDLQFVVSGIGQPVTEFTLNSAEGSLYADPQPDPFYQFATVNSQEVTLMAESNIRIDGTLTLPVSWTEGATDVNFEYSLEGVEDEFGPISLRGRDYPAPNVINALISFSGGSIAFSGNGQLINGFEVRSESGAIENVDIGSFGPFKVEVDPTETLAKFIAEEPVAVNWLTVPFVKWNQNGEADLEFSFDVAGSRPVAVITQTNFSPVVPEPSGFALSSLAILTPVGLIRKPRTIAG